MYFMTSVKSVSYQKKDKDIQIGLFSIFNLLGFT